MSAYLRRCIAHEGVVLREPSALMTGGDPVGFLVVSCTGMGTAQLQSISATATQPAVFGSLLILYASGTLTAIDALRGDCGPDRSPDCATVWSTFASGEPVDRTTLSVGTGLIPLARESRINILDCTECEAAVGRAVAHSGPRNRPPRSPTWLGVFAIWRCCWCRRVEMESVDRSGAGRLLAGVVPLMSWASS